MLTDLEDNTLEALIDGHGLARIIQALADICEGKSEHIRDNWQDDITAKPWDRIATSLETVADEAMSLGLRK